MRPQMVGLTVSLLLVFLLSACMAQSSASIDQPPAESVIVPTAQVVDYVDVLNNSEEYDNIFISVAGQISEFRREGSNVFYFYDRLGNSSGGKKFIVYIDRKAYEENYSQPLNLGDYVTVEGIWKSSNNSYSDNRLTEATVTSVGVDAQKVVVKHLSAWKKSKDNLSKELPLIDYLDVIENGEKYQDQYIRIAGRVSSSSTYPVANYVYFHFEGLEKYGNDITVYLQGCPQEMQSLCAEGEYVVVTGIASNSKYGVSLYDCYVESAGEKAQKAYESITSNRSTQDPNSTPDPAEAPARTWILNTNTMKIHYPSCSSVSDIAPHNYAESTAALETLLAQGYSRCGRCF